MVSNPKAWKTVFEAKEPHSLPLHEPWYSRLDRFLKLLLVGRLRPDKLCDMAFSYVSDHVGYKFVEPVVLDLGRVFSESEAWQALIYTINGPNEAAKSIRAFADDKGKELLRLSMQDVRKGTIEAQMARSRSSGENWLLMENFEVAQSKWDLLKHHSFLDHDFNPNYRLWIVTKECNDFPLVALKRGIKLAWEPPNNMRDLMKHCFVNGPIRTSKCWHGNNKPSPTKGGGNGGSTVSAPPGSASSAGAPKGGGGSRQLGNERYFSRLLYCLTFFHASLNERFKYGTRGGFSSLHSFSGDDLAMAVNYLEIINKEFDSIPFPGLLELLENSTYFSLMDDSQDKALLRVILHTCINENVLTANRYKFSSSNHFFVPNKTLYKDYYEFVKSLPAKSDHETLDLDPTAQAEFDLVKSRRFLQDLWRALGKLGSSVSLDSPACSMSKYHFLKVACQRLTIEVDAALAKETNSSCSAEGSAATKDKDAATDQTEVPAAGMGDARGGLSWVWRCEQASFRKCLLKARGCLERLGKCVDGKRVLDNRSLEITRILFTGNVPDSWWVPQPASSSGSESSDSLRNLSIDKFCEITAKRSTFFSEVALVEEEGTTSGPAAQVVPMSILSDPNKLLTAVKFNFARRRGVSIKRVEIRGVFVKERDPELEATLQAEVLPVTDLLLQGANWAFNKQCLIDRKVSMIDDFDVGFAYLYPEETAEVPDAAESMASSSRGSSQAESEEAKATDEVPAAPEEGTTEAVVHRYKCPFYATMNRHYADIKRSSLIGHVNLNAEVAPDLLAKRGAMLAVRM